MHYTLHTGAGAGVGAETETGAWAGEGAGAETGEGAETRAGAETGAGAAAETGAGVEIEAGAVAVVQRLEDLIRGGMEGPQADEAAQYLTEKIFKAMFEVMAGEGAGAGIVLGIGEERQRYLELLEEVMAMEGTEGMAQSLLESLAEDREGGGWEGVRDWEGVGPGVGMEGERQRMQQRLHESMAKMAGEGEGEGEGVGVGAEGKMAELMQRTMSKMGVFGR
mmetsp:Transcript_26211/g.58019  ORF Transcript_26211/g.58019 Transcript_26211/m.58019 type:complete len:222 (+) Transcript_26211:330-995(+)